MTMADSLVFCTYFDSRYLPRALALFPSVRRLAAAARLYALCMDDLAYEVLEGLSWEGLIPVRLAQFEEGDGALAAAKANRSRVEYYFTCTPSLPCYLMDRNPEIERIFYIDADFYFFSDAAAIGDEMGSGSVYIVEHRFPQSQRALEKYGRFNVGILGFRNDASGRQCLERWRCLCLQWCYDRLEDGRFADQKYLDDWPAAVDGLVISQHPGINLGPWNKANYRLDAADRVPRVNGVPVVCYHFHGMSFYRGGLVELQRADYGSPLGRNWTRWLYKPYLRELASVKRHLPAAERGDLRYPGLMALLGLLPRLARSQFLLQIGTRVVG